MAAKPIPEGYTTLSPYIAVDDAKRAIEFYKEAFGATERGAMLGPDGNIAHAEIQIGDTVLMLSDPFEQSSFRSPTERGGPTGGLFMYVEDTDAAAERAEKAGATITMPPQDMFWGDRYATVTDPFGHQWMIATRIEDLSMDEVERRGKEAMAGTS